LLQIPAILSIGGKQKKKEDEAGARPKERQTERRIWLATIRFWGVEGAWAGGLIDGKYGKEATRATCIAPECVGAIAPVRIHVERIPIRNCY
jgi:hypothetical protein